MCPFIEYADPPEVSSSGIQLATTLVASSFRHGPSMLTLLVDDDPFFIAILKRYLHLGGYSVETVADVASASQRVKEGGIHTVIVSSTMREGTRFWEQSQLYYPNVAFLLATFNNYSDNRLYLPMPLSLERVLLAMQRAEAYRQTAMVSPQPSVQPAR